MRIRALAPLLLGLIVMANHCPPTPSPAPGSGGVQLPPTQVPTVAEANTTLRMDDLMYIEDDTYGADPGGLVGKVLEVDADGSACATTNPEGQSYFVDRVSAFAISPSVAPVLRGSEVITKSLAGQLKMLSYLSVSLSDSTVYSILVTDQNIRRADDASTEYKTARAAWVTAHQALFTDPNVCWLALVDGVVQKTIVRRHFSRNQANASAGALGINVGGQYYASDDSYQMDERFGLSISILKKPKAGPLTISNLSLTSSDSALLGGIKRVIERPLH